MTEDSSVETLNATPVPAAAIAPITSAQIADVNRKRWWNCAKVD
jgi:hypothetical protein